MVDAPTAIALGDGGTLHNAGSLLVGGDGRIGRTTLEGDLVQSATGRLVVETSHSTGSSDLLDVQGNARLAGTVEVHPVTLANRAVTVLSATEGLAIDPDLDASRTYLYRFDTRQSGNSLQVHPAAEFSTTAGSFGRNQRRVAAHLQRLWDSGATLDEGFTALAGIGDGRSYARALNSLSGQTVGAIAAFRYSSSHGFITNMLDECATFEGAGVTQDEASCAWARVFGGVTDQDGTADALGYHTSAWTLQAGSQREIYLAGSSVDRSGMRTAVSAAMTAARGSAATACCSARSSATRPDRGRPRVGSTSATAGTTAGARWKPAASRRPPSFAEHLACGRACAPCLPSVP